MTAKLLMLVAVAVLLAAVVTEAYHTHGRVYYVPQPFYRPYPRHYVYYGDSPDNFDFNYNT